MGINGRSRCYCMKYGMLADRGKEGTKGHRRTDRRDLSTASSISASGSHVHDIQSTVSHPTSAHALLYVMEGGAGR